jgi:hypothetical protein
VNKKEPFKPQGAVEGEYNTPKVKTTFKKI